MSPCTTTFVCQHRLLTERLDIKRIKLVVGFSMGAQQAYQWAALYPDTVEAIAPICGSARTSPHNYLFLEGVKAALTADATFAEGWYQTPPVKGLRALARVYMGWAFSQDFFREHEYRKMGLASLEDSVRFLEGYFRRHDANDLLAMLWTWQHADLSANPIYKGDFTAQRAGSCADVQCKTTAHSVILGTRGRFGGSPAGRRSAGERSAAFSSEQPKCGHAARLVEPSRLTLDRGRYRDPRQGIF
jgi:homoserine acetyltransferase